MKTLKKFNQEYDNILHSEIPDSKKGKRYADLMGEMESIYKIPILRDKDWEQEHRAVIALYRKISMSRKI